MTWHRKLTLLTLSAAAVLGGVPQLAWAGAWAQPKGHVYTKLSSIFYHSDEVFDAAGDRQPTTIYGSDFRANQGFSLSGIRPARTPHGDHPGERRVPGVGEQHPPQRPAPDHECVGDVVLGAKYQLVSRPIVLSPFVNVKIPTTYDDELNPALGTGSMDVELRLLVARSFFPCRLISEPRRDIAFAADCSRIRSASVVKSVPRP